MSRTAWTAAVLLLARLLMLVVLAMAMQFRFSNKAHFDFVGAGYNSDLQSYTYAVVAAAVGMAGSVLQIPIAVYLLCKSKRTTPSAHVLDVSTWSPWFGASVDLVEYIKHAGSRWDDDANHDLIRYYQKGNIAIVFLFVGMVVSLCATVGSVRLRVRASNGGLDDF